LTEKKRGVPAEQVKPLTGTMRGLERDQMANKDPVFARFLSNPKVKPIQGTVYLICTSAGEVGIDISADYMICDLTPLDSIIQRLGRVNRRGEGSSEVDIIYEEDREPKPKSIDYESARWKTKEILESLPGCDWDTDRLDCSPFSLITNLDSNFNKESFTPVPDILPATDILFDAWAMTSIRQKMPGRPPVEPYLHGISKFEPPETYVAWREEVEIITGELLERYSPQDLLEDYPIKPHELLHDRTFRIMEQLEILVNRNSNVYRHKDMVVWVMDDDGNVNVTPLTKLIEKNNQNKFLFDLSHKTLLLSPSLGGLREGVFEGGSECANDVSSENVPRWRGWDGDVPPEGMRLICSIDTNPFADEIDSDDGESSQKRFWNWYENPILSGNDLSMTPRQKGFF
jgi:CRISPR-associated endonuclease/helicase Cas3